MTEPNIERIARICHEANRAYCESIGDQTQEPWETAQRWQKDSAIEGVHNALTGASPEQSHENWMKAKIQAGWTWGVVKDPDAKTHPALLPYAQLPDDVKLKDEIFITIVSIMKGYLRDEPELVPA